MRVRFGDRQEHAFRQVEFEEPIRRRRRAASEGWVRPAGLPQRPGLCDGSPGPLLEALMGPGGSAALRTSDSSLPKAARCTWKRLTGICQPEAGCGLNPCPTLWLRQSHLWRTGGLPPQGATCPPLPGQGCLPTAKRAESARPPRAPSALATQLASVSPLCRANCSPDYSLHGRARLPTTEGSLMAEQPSQSTASLRIPPGCL